jgi:hypothetical protein
VSNIGPVREAGHREREALRKVWDKGPYSWHYPFENFLDAAKYDASRDELILPNGTRVSIQSVNNGGSK